MLISSSVSLSNEYFNFSSIIMVIDFPFFLSNENYSVEANCVAGCVDGSILLFRSTKLNRCTEWITFFRWFEKLGQPQCAVPSCNRVLFAKKRKCKRRTSNPRLFYLLNLLHVIKRHCGACERASVCVCLRTKCVGFHSQKAHPIAIDEIKFVEIDKIEFFSFARNTQQTSMPNCTVIERSMCLRQSKCLCLIVGPDCQHLKFGANEKEEDDTGK